MKSPVYHLSLPPKNIDTAAPLAREVLQAVKNEFKVVPNMYAYMANAPALLSTYSHGYKLFRKESGFSHIEQEVIFLTISYENQCDYCMAAHSVVADMISKVPVEVTDAIRNGTSVPDKKLKALHDFTSVMVNKRGLPTNEDVSPFLQAGYKEEQLLYIILAISIKTLSNYSNHIFHTPVDAMFKAREWSIYKMARNVMNFFRRGKVVKLES